MALDSKHPLYSEFLGDWLTMRHTSRGERVVKSQTTLYLPPTSGMLADGGNPQTGQLNPNTPGWHAYKAYITRAVFHDFVRQAVETLIGVMHHKPASIELPKAMEPLIERATNQGESLQVLLRRINEAQLTTGRVGLLLDLPNAPVPGKVLPYVCAYRAEDILNWDDGRREGLTLQKLNFVSLNESEAERQPNFEWMNVDKYRVLILGEPETNEAAGVYRFAVFRQDAGGTAFDESKLTAPSIMGRTLDEIPFVFINGKDIVPQPDDPPLIGLAKLALAIYRGEADYRQSLFMQGQDTLVITGGGDAEDTKRVGANATLNLPMGGTAEYIGVESKGLSEMREALESDKKQAAAKGGQLLDTTSREKESGDALKTRVSAQTATLNQIALAGAFGLQQLLRVAARWLGLDPGQVKVTPNLDFDDTELTGKELVDLVSAKNLGAPLARTTIHDIMRDRGMTEKTFEEEMAEVESEEPVTPGTTLPVDPNADDEPVE